MNKRVAAKTTWFVVFFLGILLLCACIARSEELPDATSQIPLNEVIEDMTRNNDMDAHGLASPENSREGEPGDGKGEIQAGNTPPEGWESITMWGSAYEGVAGSEATNVLVAVKEPKLYVLSKSKNRWVEIVNEDARNVLEASGLPLVDGALYVEGFAESGQYEVEDDGSGEKGALAAKPGQGFMFHFWPATGRASLYSEGGVVDADDIQGIFVTFQGKLIQEAESQPGNFDEAVYVMHAGADYWQDVDGNNGNVSVGYGRFKLVTKAWRHFSFTTLSVEELNALPLPPGVVGVQAMGAQNEDRVEIQKENVNHPYTGENPPAVMVLLCSLIIGSVFVVVRKRRRA